MKLVDRQQSVSFAISGEHDRRCDYCVPASGGEKLRRKASRKETQPSPDPGPGREKRMSRGCVQVGPQFCDGRQTRYRLEREADVRVRGPIAAVSVRLHVGNGAWCNRPANGAGASPATRRVYSRKLTARANK